MPTYQSRVTFYNLALQEYNKGKTSFTFVKKGTEEYDEVKAIEKRLKEEDGKKEEEEEGV